MFWQSCGHPLLDFPGALALYAPMSRCIIRGVLALSLLALAGPAGGQTDREIEELFWESVECESAGQVGAYLEVYQNGAYVEAARKCLEEQLGLDRAARVSIQQGLAALDYEIGAADGLFGPSTRRALRQWQAGKGFTATGYLTREQADTLVATGRDAVQQEESDRLAQEAAREEAARQARAADDTAYAEAQQLDTAAAYGDYLATYPAGLRAAEARARQTTLRAREEAERRQADAFRRRQSDVIRRARESVREEGQPARGWIFR